MRKEVIWAIIAGVVLGLIVAFGVYRANAKMSGTKRQTAKLATPSPKPGQSEFKIVLDKPENADVVTTKTVAVSGLTKPDSWITFSGEDSDYVIQSDEKGTFNQEVDLTPGVNQIKVTAFESSGVKSATQVLVVFSSSFQEKSAPTDSPSQGATETSDIRAKVAANVARTLNRPKAYIGTVTDITDSTIQIKNMESLIEQISVSKETVVTNSTGNTTKTVKTTDIAIGDFVVAMGYIGANSVLSAQRILVTTALTEPKLTINQAKVTSVTKNALSVNVTSDGTTDTVTPDKNTDIVAVAKGVSKTAKFITIEADDAVIYVVTADAKGVETVRSIFQVE